MPESKIEKVKKLKPNMVVVHCSTNDLAKLPSGPTPEMVESLVSRTVDFAKQFSTDISVVFLAVIPRYEKSGRKFGNSRSTRVSLTSKCGRTQTALAAVLTPMCHQIITLARCRDGGPALT